MTLPDSPIRRLILRAGVAALAAPLLWPLAAAAHSYKLGDISIGHVWAPPSEGTEGVAVYGPILNGSAETVVLRGVSSPVAAKARFRVKTKEGDTSWPETIDFAPGKPLALAPWRTHVWLSELKAPLKAGDAFELTLDFGDAGTKTVEVEVQDKAGH